jgi:hypothetical protein
MVCCGVDRQATGDLFASGDFSLLLRVKLSGMRDQRRFYANSVKNGVHSMPIMWKRCRHVISATCSGNVTVCVCAFHFPHKLHFATLQNRNATT